MSLDSVSDGYGQNRLLRNLSTRLDRNFWISKGINMSNIRDHFVMKFALQLESQYLILVQSGQQYSITIFYCVFLRTIGQDTCILNVIKYFGVLSTNWLLSCSSSYRCYSQELLKLAKRKPAMLSMRFSTALYNAWQ